MMLDSSKIEEKEPSKEVLKNLKHEKARGFLEPSEKEKEDKTSVEIKQSMNFKDMLPMFIEAGLEFKPDSPDPERLLVCFELIDKASRKHIGGGSLAKVYDEFLPAVSPWL